MGSNIKINLKNIFDENQTRINYMFLWHDNQASVDINGKAVPVTDHGGL
jgi:hypothetical protein